MGGIQDKGEAPRRYAEIETIIKDPQEQLKAQDNHLISKGLKMRYFAYASFGDLTDEVLKEIPRGGFGIFVNAWYLCEFCNMDYTSDSLFLERGNKVRGLGFKSSVEAHVKSTFDQRYPLFLGGHSSRDMDIGTLLPILSTFDKFSRSGISGTRHKLERDLMNARIKIPVEICLDI